MKKMKFAMLLVMVLVFALQSVGMMPAAAEETHALIDVEKWKTEDVSLTNLVDYMGPVSQYGVITQHYIQGGHSEANVFADKISREPGRTDPFLASGDTVGATEESRVQATLTLPEIHIADKLTFSLFVKDEDGNMVEVAHDGVYDHRISVDVAGETSVQLTFPPVTCHDHMMENLYVCQVDDDGQIVYPDIDINSDGMRVTYGPPVISERRKALYLGDITYTGDDTFNLFQNGSDVGVCDVMELGAGIKLYQQKDGAFVELTPGTGVGEVVDRIFIHDDSWPEGSKYPIINSLKFDTDGKFKLSESNYEIDVVYLQETESNKAEKMLDDLAELSYKLSNSELGIGGALKDGMKLGDLPVEGGNSTVTGATQDGAVLSLYHAGLTAASTATDFYVDMSDLVPEGGDPSGTGWKNGGLPIADNEYVIINLVVPSANGTIHLNDQGLELSLRNSDGTQHKTNMWRKTPNLSFSRVIWNPVYWDEGSNSYQPFQGTVMAGNAHGGIVLAPYADIDQPSVGDAVTLIGESVKNSNGQEIHQTSFQGARTFVRMVNEPATAVKVKKEWADRGHEDARPDSISIHLYANVGTAEKVKITTITLPIIETKPDGKQEEKWEVTLENLPKTANGVDIVYSIEEIVDFSYYKPSYDTTTGPAHHDLKVKNTYDANTLVVAGTKIWDDADDQDGKRPESITVTLQSRWAHRTQHWEGPMFAGHWVWDDWGDYTQWQDHHISMQYVDPNVQDTFTISADTDWKYNFGQFQTLFENDLGYGGRKEQYRWEYRVVEKAVPTGYKVTYSNMDANGDVVDKGAAHDITNAHAPEKINISGSKVWHNDVGAYQPDSVTVRLYTVENNELKDTGKSCTVNAASEWKWSFDDLDKYANGKEIEYRVKEEEVQGFYSEHVVDKDGNIVIHNIVKTVTLKGTKAWKLPANTQWPPVSEVEIQIFRKGETADTLMTTVKASQYINNWAWSVDLPGYDTEGNPAEYYIKESFVPNYKGELTQNSKTNNTNGGYTADYTLTNTFTPISLEVKKVWNDSNNVFGLRPEKLVFYLQSSTDGVNWSNVWNNNGQAIKQEVAITGTQNEYTVTFNDLVEYKDAETKYQYRAVEKFVVNGTEWDTLPGYDAVIGTSEKDQTTGNFSVTITNSLKGKISGTKEWRGVFPWEWGGLPDEITLNLLYKADENTEAVIVATTTAKAPDYKWEFTGIPENLSKDELAKFTVHEVPVQGYTSDDVTIGDYTGNELVNNRMRATGRLVLYKVYLNEEGKNQVLPGAVFGIYYDENCDQPIAEDNKHLYTTDDNGMIEVRGLTAERTYYIREETAPDGYVLDQTVLSVYVEKEDRLGTNPSRVNGEHGVVINEKATEATTVTLPVTKELQAANEFIRLPYDINETFEFAIAADEATAKLTGWEIVKDKAAVTLEGTGSVTTPVADAFSIKFTQAGTYAFEVKETTPGTGYVKTDKTVYTVTYTVAESNGSLNATPTIKKGNENADEVAFVNTYGSFSISGEKVWQDADESLRLQVDEFSERYLELYTVDATGKQTKVTGYAINPEGSSDGAYLTVYEEGDDRFYWNFIGLPAYDATGNALTYVVKELTVKGYQTFYVNNTGTGAQPDGIYEEAPRPAVTDRTYSIYNILADATLTIKKTVEVQGNVQPDTLPEFQFTITPAEGLTGYHVLDEADNELTLPTTVNVKMAKDADGNIVGTLPVTILFDSFVGTEKEFTFTVKETGTAPDGWTYDATEQTVTFTVKRNQSALEPSDSPVMSQPVDVFADSTSGGTASFTNTYKVEEKTSINVLKHWPTSKGIIVSKYLFLCTLDADGKPVKLNPQPQVKYTEVQLPEDVEHHYTWSDLPKYDDKGNEIKYVVIEEGLDGYFTSYDNGSGGSDSYAGNGGVIVNRIARDFFRISKDVDNYNGAELPTDIAFNFTITPGEKNPGDCELRQVDWEAETETKLTPDETGVYTVSLAANEGSDFGVYFPVVAGTYTFVVQEVVPSPLPDNWAYDTHTYTVTFEVADDGSVEMSQSGEDDDVFTNKYYGTTDLEITKYWEFDTAATRPVKPETFAQYLTLRYAEYPLDTEGDPVYDHEFTENEWKEYTGITPSVEVDDVIENEWVITYENLPRFIGDKVVTWSVVEKDIPGYTKLYDWDSNAQWAENDITNTLELTSVSVTKEWVGGRQAELNIAEYLTLYADGDKVELSPACNGNVYTWNELPKYENGKLIAYTVKETTVPDGYTVTYLNEVGEDAGELVPGDFAQDGGKIVNTYATKGAIVLEGTKVLEGRTLKADEFSFELKDAKGNVLQTKKNAQDGSIVFDKIEYTEADLSKSPIKYTISEVKGSEIGMTYAANVAEVTVTLTDNGDGTIKAEADKSKDEIKFVNTYAVDGKLILQASKSLSGSTLKNGQFEFTLTGEGENQTVKNNGSAVVFAAIEYDEADIGKTFTYTVAEKAGNAPGYTYDETKYTVVVKVVMNDGKLTPEYTVDGETGKAMTFKNAYAAKGAIVLEGTKILEGRTLAAGEFSFELKDANGNVLQTKKNAQDGSIVFDKIEYTEADLSKSPIKYTISEVKDSEIGMTYAANVAEVTVTLTDNGDGTIDAKADKTKEEIEFVNTYEEKVYEAKGSIVLEGVKTLEGRTLKAGEFTFEVKNAADKVIATGTNDAAGKITFTEIKYTEKDAGKTYTYKVYEVKGDLPGVTYVEEPVTVKVTVTDNGDGTLTAALTKDSPAISFKNTYEAEGTVTFKGAKFLMGREFKQGDEFTFELLNEKGDVIDTVTINPTSGTKADFAFKTIKYELADAGKTYTYTYRVKEKAGTEDGMTYDDTIHTVTVTVSDAGDGSLKVVASDSANKLNFTNTYLAEGSVLFSGTKTMNGKALVGKDFTFVLTDADGKEIETVTNDKDGKIVFSTIQYDLEDAGKTFTYKVSEKNDGKKAVTYDDTVYTVTVKVEDTGDGHLKVTASDNAAKLNFTNSYEAKAYLTLNAFKTVNGYKPTADQVYDFVLLCDDGAEMTAQNKDENIIFGTLTFNEDDIGKTFIYTVKETTEANELLEVDTAIYQVAVTVVDNGDGNLKLETEFLKDGKRASGVVFANTATATLAISKSVKGPGPDKAFDLKVTFIGVDGKELEGVYDYDGDVKGTITSGGVIALKDGQSVTIVGLPEGATYTVEENAGPAYTVTVNGKPIAKAEGTLVGHGKLEFINTVETTTFSVTKVWEGMDLGEITLTLYADGKQITPQPEVTREGNKYTYYNLPKYNEEGEEIVYSAKERGIDGYIRIYNNVEPYQDVTSVVHDGGTIINREIQEEVHELSFKIRKVWTGVEATEEIPAITLTLYCNGEKLDVPTPKPNSEGWYKYYDLPKTVNGQIAVYTVVEEPIPGYTVTYKTASGEIVEEGVNGGEIINAKIPQTGDPATLGLWLALMGASAVLLTMLQRRRKA